MGSDYASGEPEGEDGPVIFSNLAEASPTGWNERPYLQEGYIKTHWRVCTSYLSHPCLVSPSQFSGTKQKFILLPHSGSWEE